MTTLHTRALWLSMLLAVAATGCTHQTDIKTPDGFAVLKDKRYDYRASSAEGVVLAVRDNANEPQGDLDFWSGALHAHLERRGYVTQETQKVRSADGIEGRQVRYEVKRRGRPHLFWFTVFVTDSKVITVEAGGDEAFFKDKDKALSNALRSLEVG